MKISILTLFPEMFTGPFDHSIIKHAKEKGLVDIQLINIRDFGIGKHRLVDDTPFGGGIGMVMRVDVLHAAIEHAKQQKTTKESKETNESKVVLLSASGETFRQQKANEYSPLDHLILVCGHYEGVDERVTNFVDEQISIGDFVTTGGEIPAMLITDAVARLIPGVLKARATDAESFSLSQKNIQGSLLEYPHYAKPRAYQNLLVPDVLLSGDHRKIEAWRLEQAKKRTKDRRPDIMRTENRERKTDSR